VPIFICNDAISALAAGTEGRMNGIVLVAGTGSVALGCLDQHCVRVGGWGPRFGEQVSSGLSSIQGV
jgi:N-acetylglucosamine kinase-like BadF-type ATPase